MQSLEAKGCNFILIQDVNNENQNYKQIKKQFFSIIHCIIKVKFYLTYLDSKKINCNSIYNLKIYLSHRLRLGA